MKTKRTTPELDALAAVANAHKRAKFPNVPSSALPRSTYADGTANDLTRAVLDFINLQAGATAWRTSNAPTFDQRTGKFRAGNVLKGVADIAAIRDGKALQIEIKAGKDRMSDDQKAFAERVANAGGAYVLARTFSGFVSSWQDLAPIEFLSDEMNQIWRGATAENSLKSRP